MERELIERCQSLYDSHESQSALAQLDGVGWSPDAGVPSKDHVDALLLKVRCLMRLERFRAAFQLVDVLSTPEPPDHRAGDLLRLKGVLWRLARNRVDQSIFELQRAYELTPPGERRALVGAELAYCMAAKGCHDSAFAAIERACDECADPAREPLVWYRHGQLLAMARELPRSRAIFEELLAAPGGDRLARDGLAFIELAEGNIGRASAHLDALGPAYPDELWLRRRRLRLLASIDPDSERALLEEIRATSRESDYAEADRFRIAELYYLAGDLDAAREEAEPLEAAEDAVISRRARQLLETLRAAGAVASALGEIDALTGDLEPSGGSVLGGPPIVQLEDVPFLASAREPGRAALELALATLGRPAEADWIPEVASLGQAAEFCALAGLRTVRCLGEDEELARLLEIGAPILISRDEQLRLVVGWDPWRRAALIREPAEVGARYVDRGLLADWLEDGCMAVLPGSTESPVASHPALVELDRAQRQLDDGLIEQAQATFERLTAALPGRSLPWELLLEVVLEPFELDAVTPELEDPAAALGRAASILADAERACADESGTLPPGLIACRGRLDELRDHVESAADAYARAADARGDNLMLLVRAGEMYRQLGRQEAAERLFWRALELAPYHPGANMSIAGLYCDEEDARLARHFVRVAMELAPGEGYNLLNLGRLREMEGAYEAAAEAYEQALATRRGDAFVLERLGLALSHQGLFEEAIARLELAIEAKEGPEGSGPIHLTGRLSLADVMLRAGRPDTALAICEVVAETMPDYPAALAIAGVALCELRRPEEGIVRLREALEIDPDYAWARQQLAAIYGEAGRPHDARRLLAEAAERDPEDGWTQSQLAAQLKELGRDEEARESLMRACRVGAYADVGLLEQLLELLKARGEHAEAVDQVAAALRRHPDRPRIRRLAVRALADAGRWRELEPHVQALLARQPGDPEMLLYAAQLACVAGDDEHGAALLDEALATSPGDEETVYRMVRLLADLDRPEAARRAFEWSRAPEDPAMVVQGLRVYTREPRYLEHCLALAEAGVRATDGADPFYLSQVAVHAVQLGRREQAHRALAEAIALVPDDPWPHLLLARVLAPTGEVGPALATIDRAESLGEDATICDWARLDVLLEGHAWSSAAALAEEMALDAEHGRAVVPLDEDEDDADDPGAGERDSLSPAMAARARLLRARALLHAEGVDAFEEEVARIEAAGALEARTIGRLAESAWEAGELALARVLVERGLDADASDPGALLVLGRWREQRGDEEGARGAFEELLELHPDHPAGHACLGRLLSRAEAIRAAEPHVRAAVELDPRRPEAWCALAHWHLRGGDLGRALPPLVRSYWLRPLRRFAEIDEALRRWLEGDAEAAAVLLGAAEMHAERFGAPWQADLVWAQQLVLGA